MKKFPLIIFTLILTLGIGSGYEACTRVVYKGTDNTVITARSMDWRDEIPANLWVFPRGIQRTGEVGPSSIQWTSKYGSIISSSWDITSADGMNEKGLVANMLWLGESQYPEFNPKGRQKGLAISLWAQYFLDNFGTVKEAVDHLKKDPFIIVSDYIPGTEKFATVHLSLSDASGDNAVFEYINGKLVVHHDPKYTVMTNSPVFDEQLALNNYWQGIPGTIMLPGTNRAADRFVRASYYINAIPKTNDTRTAVASVFSVIRNCSVPYGITSDTEPNISSTRWRSVSDQKNLVYYFETVFTPNTFWVDLKDFDLNPKAKVMKLDLSNFQTYNGKSNKDFKESAPFKFLGI
ncbi:linear amide C-N hydrolase [Chryseobacterium carnipullorum]|uniref:Linear amide C-N hydrolase n=1 Tax=Chryseobacterium carnipullorum TaxID=1124835 RepID=A0A3G6NBW7_CHRCU|nr:linear amide C-N hydrolase [Chryseobacterium carnipullorum]AZA48929.1 linear amide C-N hydrolase [Chryseobacterium carnipullorum]AZA63828.1 linear amide C-N hydrolase [Chryseobacterium carnipullorum]MDN5422008.1 linear amide C-N hydrolase [Chryseobacterium sp.]